MEVQGHGVVELVGQAPDAQTAIQVVRAKNPDVVLSDLSMPNFPAGSAGDNGKFTVAAELGASHLVCMMSSNTKPDLILRALGTGAVGYLGIAS